MLQTISIVTLLFIAILATLCVLILYCIYQIVKEYTRQIMERSIKIYQSSNPVLYI